MLLSEYALYNLYSFGYFGKAHTGTPLSAAGAYCAAIKPKKLTSYQF
jgi:hypothetical protein